LNPQKAVVCREQLFASDQAMAVPVNMGTVGYAAEKSGADASAPQSKTLCAKR
jgi:hypothetical protein